MYTASTVPTLVLLLFIQSAVIILELCEACCEKPAKKLDEKWEALREPLLRKRALQITQKQMLNVLGLNELPKPSRRVIRPHAFMLNLYKTLSRGEKRTTTKETSRELINTVRGVVDQEIYDRSVSQPNHQLYVFNLSTIPSTDRMVTAELRVLRRPKSVEKEIAAVYGTAFKATIYIKSSSFITNRTPYNEGFEPLDSFSFDITDTEETWNVFTVTKAVQQWQRTSKDIHYLQLSVKSTLTGKLVSPLKLGFRKEKRMYSNRALLVVFSDDGKAKPTVQTSPATNGKRHKRKSVPKEEDKWVDGFHPKTGTKRETSSRVKRASNADVENVMKKLGRGPRRRKKKSYCRRKPLYVDFEKLDWGNWVIAPRGYNAYLCEGICNFPLDKHLRPTNHATVQTILNTVDPLSVPPVCCAPNKLSPISILYIDPGEAIVYKKYEDMVVDRCGCS